MKLSLIRIGSLAVAALVGSLLTLMVLWCVGYFQPHNVKPASSVQEENKEEHHGVELTEKQLADNNIQLETASLSLFSSGLTLPGQILLNADKEARILASVNGVVRSSSVKVGDRVKKGAVLAVLDSREFSDASAALLSAKGRLGLMTEKLKREKLLWEKKISAEQDYLDAQQSVNELKIEVSNAEQKLIALGVSADAVKNWQSTNRGGYELRSPIAGTLLSKDITIGEALSPDKLIFRVADLSSVWVEVAVPVVNIGDIKVGQAVRVLSSGNHQQAEEKGQVIAIQPELDAASRSARVRIQLNNSHENWRVGEYVKANINTSQEKSVISIPLSAVIFEGEEASVFVQDGHELEPRLLKLGQKNADRVEVLSGLEVGERYATGSVFILKAEMGKSEASHEH